MTVTSSSSLKSESSNKCLPHENICRILHGIRNKFLFGADYHNHQSHHAPSHSNSNPWLSFLFKNYSYPNNERKLNNNHHHINNHINHHDHHHHSDHHNHEEHQEDFFMSIYFIGAVELINTAAGAIVVLSLILVTINLFFVLFNSTLGK
jgi:ABC-type nickel/cobalt efflux system permease component RcnA